MNKKEDLGHYVRGQCRCPRQAISWCRKIFDRRYDRAVIILGRGSHVPLIPASLPESVLLCVASDGLNIFGNILTKMHRNSKDEGECDEENIEPINRRLSRPPCFFFFLVQGCTLLRRSKLTSR